MHITVLHNAVTADARDDERDVLVQVEAVEEALQALGHESMVLACTLNLEDLHRQLTQARPAVVFNLTEGLGGTDRLQHLAPSLLEALDLPYTGAPAWALFLTNDKLLAKEQLRSAGLPTPAWAVADTAQESPLRGPVILKAIHEHASVGIDDNAIIDCPDGRELAEQLRAAESRLSKPCFAEQFIDGREFHLSLLASPSGPQVLPPGEIEFNRFPPGKPRIVNYRAKWDEGSFEFEHTSRRFDFPDSDAALLERLSGLARQCWKLFGLRGYVRVDFRVDGGGQPWILEVNTNPRIAPEGGFASALERAQITYAGAIQRVLDDVP